MGTHATAKCIKVLSFEIATRLLHRHSSLDNRSSISGRRMDPHFDYVYRKNFHVDGLFDTAH